MFKPRQDVELLLRRDWGTNVPYKLEFSTEKGHFLVATQDLKQGELILEETPYVRAPLNEKCCLACFAHCADKCAICNQYLCQSDDCKNSTEHQLECQILAGKNLPPIEPSVILVLRVLRLQTPDFGLLLSNLEKFKSDPEWMQKRKRHVDFIQKLEMPGVDQDSILAILAIDATNGQTGTFFTLGIKIVCGMFMFAMFIYGTFR